MNLSLLLDFLCRDFLSLRFLTLLIRPDITRSTYCNKLAFTIYVQSLLIYINIINVIFLGWCSRYRDKLAFAVHIQSVLFDLHLVLLLQYWLESFYSF